MASPLAEAEVLPPTTVSADRQVCQPRTRVGRFLNPNPQRVLLIASWVLLAVWCVWWTVSLSKASLVGVHRGWFGKAPCFGGDFYTGVYVPTNTWLAGGDPYDQHVEKKFFFIYPPMTHWVFAWCGLLTARQAGVVCVCMLGLAAAFGALAAFQTRRRLGLSHLPWQLVLVAVLFSSPVVFAMERGNCDLVIVVLIGCGAALMRSKSWVAQLMAGVILSLAPWLKVYPGLLGVGLLGLRRWHAFLGFVLGGLLFGAINYHEVPLFVRNCSQFVNEWAALERQAPPSSPHPWAHSLPQNWKNMLRNTPPPFVWLQKVNGLVATLILFAPLVVWTSYHVSRSRHKDDLAFAYLAWITAVASCIPNNANDYSFAFLPIAAIAVWDRRDDPLLVQISLACLLLWWQPLGLPIDGGLLLLIKSAALAAVGIALAERACDSVPLVQPQEC